MNIKDLENLNLNYLLEFHHVPGGFGQDGMGPPDWRPADERYPNSLPWFPIPPNQFGPYNPGPYPHPDEEEIPYYQDPNRGIYGPGMPYFQPPGLPSWAEPGFWDM